MNTNLLAQESSPYLLQHKNNPVAWHPWGASALAEAARGDKPILLSIGYAACHWCHVMAHESFENQEIGTLMNELFVNIKVDREERPDLDAIYQAALALLGEHGGWPLTMFLTPNAEPFWGGTYFPPTTRFGRPAFGDVLRRVAELFREQRDSVRHNADALLGALRKMSDITPGGAITLETTDQISDRLLQEVDSTYGGVGPAPKFPQPSILELFWRAFKRTGEDRCRDAVTLTLDRMCQGGIYDHLGGGFARYSVDQYWLVPHFEKMLYDNAQLVDVMTLVWPETKSALYAARVAETIEWVLREMRHEHGAFFSSLDADSEGEEGRFYVWAETEIDALLGPDAPVFKAAYDVTAAGNWEGHNILNRRQQRQLGSPDEEAQLATYRRHLWQAREDRIKPGLDDKILVDWNGLMITALANAGTTFGQPAWLAAAAQAFGFIQDRMADGPRLRHSWRADRLTHPATLDDYANSCRAALALYEATGADHYLEQAEAWVAVVDAQYWDQDGGGYFFTAVDTADLIIRTKSAADHAVPSGNGTMVEVLARLFYLTGKSQYRARADETVRALSGEVGRNFFPLATLLNSNAFLDHGLQIVVIGTRESPDTRELLGAVQEASLPNRVIRVTPPGTLLPIGHPALGKSQIGGKATAYVCEGPVCSLPITDRARLAADLGQR